MEKDSSYLQVRLSGTDHEGVLRAHSVMKDQPFRVHICPPQCGRQESGDFLAHGLKGRRRKEEGEEGWVTSLEPPCHGGRGRARDVEEAGAGAPAREGREGPCVLITSRPTARPPKEPEEEEIQKKKKKKKKKAKEGGRGAGERETRGQGLSEGAVTGLRGHGPRPAGEDPEESAQEGTEVRGAKKEQALQLQQQSREQWLLDQHIEW